MIAAIFFLAFGGLLTWVAAVNLKHKYEDRISLIEAVILKATGEEPLPLTRFDRCFQTFQVIMASIFGPVLLLLGIVMLIDELWSAT